MDPGNWGTDLAAGRSSNTTCCGWSPLASMMAIFLQVLSARLGIVTGKDLAQACRDWYPRWTRWPNWLLVRIGHLRLRPGRGAGQRRGPEPAVPHPAVVGRDYHCGRRVLAARFAAVRDADDRGGRAGARGDDRGVLLSSRSLSSRKPRPSFVEMGEALLSPGLRQAGMAYIAIGIIGATVMPHNLYLHSALVQSRKLQQDAGSIRSAIRFNTIDPVVALHHRVFRECGDPGAGRDGVLRQRKRERGRRRGGHLRADARLDSRGLS